MDLDEIRRHAVEIRDIKKRTGGVYFVPSAAKSFEMCVALAELVLQLVDEIERRDRAHAEALREHERSLLHPRPMN